MAKLGVITKYIKRMNDQGVPITQRSLAEATGTTAIYINRLVNGLSYPSITMAALIEMATSGGIKMMELAIEKANAKKEPLKVYSKLLVPKQKQKKSTGLAISPLRPQPTVVIDTKAVKRRVKRNVSNI